MRKNIFYLILVVSMVFTACIDDSQTGLSSDPRIASFSLSDIEKSVNLDGVEYEYKDIDGYTILITTKDSLPYGVNLDSMLFTVYQGKLGSAMIYETKDGIKQKSFNAFDAVPDTVSFADTVYVETVSGDGKNSRTYKLKFDAHKQNPDLYVWQGQSTDIYTQDATQEKLLAKDGSLLLYIKDNATTYLYTSKDAKNWAMQSLQKFPNNVDIKYTTVLKDTIFVAEGNDLYWSKSGVEWTKKTVGGVAVDNILFALEGKLYSIDNTTLKLYRLSANSWEEVPQNASYGTLPKGFPVEGAAVISDYSSNGYQRVYVVGGQDKDGNLLNSIWSTENGSHWVNLGNNSTLFTPRRDVTAFQYDNMIMLFGGRDNNGIVASAYQIYSPDYGINWKLPEGSMQITSLFQPRYNAQVAISTDKSVIYLVGGQAANGLFLKDAWRGVKNSVLWESVK